METPSFAVELRKIIQKQRFEVVTCDDIIDDILIGMNKTKGEYMIVKDRREAINKALSLAKDGEIVLLCGKGQQDYEEIYFDDDWFFRRGISAPVRELTDPRKKSAYLKIARSPRGTATDTLSKTLPTRVPFLFSMSRPAA